jgi:hypothetical protein
LFLFTFQGLRAADDVTFTAEAPRTVEMGKQFSLVYTSNSEVKNLRIPEINDFEILMGPSTSTFSSTTIINGKASSSVTYRFTYVLYPKNTGSFDISPATATINKETRKSNSLTIKVLPADQAKQPASSVGTGNQASTSSSAQVGSEQLFIRVIPSKSNVYEDEGLTVTYKLYTRVEISGYDNPKFPEFVGFFAQEIDVPDNQQWLLENYNGSNYRTAILKQTVLYPRETGKLTIDKGSFDITLRLKVDNARRGSIFDDFFDSYRDVKKTIYSNPVTINVKPLPFGKPSDFCGVAGSLRLSSTISSTTVKANDAVTIKLKITGNGNLKMLPTPEMKFPQDFEIYDPKVENQFKNTTSGVVGTKSIEYLVIPRYAGKFEIPPITLSYFDLTTGQYKTLQSEAYELLVEKGSESNQVVTGNFTDKEQLRMIGSDVRYIKTGFKVKEPTPLMIAQWWYWLYFFGLFFFTVLFLFINWKQAKENADINRVKNKKANKVAVKRLKKAAIYLKEKNQEAFYDELLKALWGYTSDKLMIPLSQLTKETIDSALASYHVSEDIRQAYNEILNTCEYARYAPSSDNHAMDDFYRKTMTVMNKMESTLKK